MSLSTSSQSSHPSASSVPSDDWRGSLSPPAEPRTTLTSHPSTRPPISLGYYPFGSRTWTHPIQSPQVNKRSSVSPRAASDVSLTPPLSHQPASATSTRSPASNASPRSYTTASVGNDYMSFPALPPPLPPTSIQVQSEARMQSIYTSAPSAQLDRIPVAATSRPARSKTDDYPFGPYLRVPQACKLCRKRKAKCSGGRPCERCVRTKTKCIYADQTGKTQRSYMVPFGWPSGGCESMDVDIRSHHEHNGSGLGRPMALSSMGGGDVPRHHSHHPYYPPPHYSTRQIHTTPAESIEMTRYRHLDSPPISTIQLSSQNHQRQLINLPNPAPSRLSVSGRGSGGSLSAQTYNEYGRAFEGPPLASSAPAATSFAGFHSIGSSGAPITFRVQNNEHKPVGFQNVEPIKGPVTSQVRESCITAKVSTAAPPSPFEEGDKAASDSSDSDSRHATRYAPLHSRSPSFQPTSSRSSSITSASQDNEGRKLPEPSAFATPTLPSSHVAVMAASVPTQPSRPAVASGTQKRPSPIWQLDFPLAGSASTYRRNSSEYLSSLPLASSSSRYLWSLPSVNGGHATMNSALRGKSHSVHRAYGVTSGGPSIPTYSSSIKPGFTSVLHTSVSQA